MHGLDSVRTWIDVVSLLIELLAGGIIVAAIGYASARVAIEALARKAFDDAYTRYKTRLARSLLLGLEILIAADIIRTVALEPTLTGVTVLGVLPVGRSPTRARAEGLVPRHRLDVTP